MQDQATTLWTMRRDNSDITCQVRLVPYGIEVDIVNGGTVVLTRVFETDVEALAWADTKRAARESQGWVLVPAEPTDHNTHTT